uniref:Uncharacterized protein n=1 Tax=Anguilla anguilla TaxID=7936 RepID=A0A0E9RSJ5_ANGAN
MFFSLSGPSHHQLKGTVQLMQSTVTSQTCSRVKVVFGNKTIHT